MDYKHPVSISNDQASRLSTLIVKKGYGSKLTISSAAAQYHSVLDHDSDRASGVHVYSNKDIYLSFDEVPDGTNGWIIPAAVPYTVPIHPVVNTLGIKAVGDTATVYVNLITME